MKWSFSKYQGAGNDFILFEDFERSFPESSIPQLCDRKMGIGADGLILLRHSKIADFSMDFFNADGSSAAMCGNGLRCFVHFLRDRKVLQAKYLIEIAGKVLTVKANQSKISTFLSPPRILHWDIEIENHPIFVVDTGVPHAVIFAEEGVDVLREGGRLRYHEKFHPEGVNVNFVTARGDGQLHVRTYERGVESETLACGTGAAAVAFVANRLGYCSEKVEIITQSQESLHVEVGNEIEVIGPSVKVFDGHVYL